MTREILTLKVNRVPKLKAKQAQSQTIINVDKPAKPAKVAKPAKKPPQPKRVRIEPEPKVDIALATGLLIDKYHDVFTSGKPLAIGCVNDLTLDGYSKTTIRRIIASFVNMPEYHGLVLSSDTRVDGSPITDAQKEYARKCLKKIKD